ncbi:unnamed protein product, partial [Mesorhabditis spiculigera]
MGQPNRKNKWRSHLAFWLFGVCNNIAYSLMLGAAADIINRDKTEIEVAKNSTCLAPSQTRKCDGHQSTGIVLLANILPALAIQIMAPIFLSHRLSFTCRQLIVVGTQASSLLLVASTKSFGWSLVGVALTSFSSGFGESTLVSLASHYPKSTLMAWSSGTGVAGISGSFLYAALTEPHMANLSPETTLHLSLFIPLIFAVAFWVILDHPGGIFALFKKQKLSAAEMIEDTSSNEKMVEAQRSASLKERIYLIKPLLPYMIPLALVYIAEYTINQGITQFLLFDCATGLGLTRESQYRWYSVLYNMGVFISRSMVCITNMHSIVILILPILQTANLVFFYFEALNSYLPHIGITFLLILFEGLFGGASYIKTINDVHAKVQPDVREFSLAIVTISDSAGIMIAAFLAIGLHNQLCDQLAVL